MFYFLAPLSTLLHVLRHRNSASLVLPLSIMNTLNGVLWATYGLAALSDPFVWVPNAFGATLGVIQMVLKLTIPSDDEAGCAALTCCAVATPPSLCLT